MPRGVQDRAESGSNELVQAVTDGKCVSRRRSPGLGIRHRKQREVVAKGKVQEAAKKIRKEKAASKGKPKKAPDPEPIPDSDEEEPRSQPPPPDDAAKPGTPTEPPETTSEEADEEKTHEDRSHCDPDDAPLLRQAHRAIDQMVQAGRSAGKMDKVAILLSKLIEFSTGYKTKFESLAMP